MPPFPLVFWLALRWPLAERLLSSPALHQCPLLSTPHSSLCALLQAAAPSQSSAQHPQLVDLVGCVWVAGLWVGCMTCAAVFKGGNVWVA